MKFLDAAFPGSVATFEMVLAFEQAQDFAYYVGGNFALHAWDTSEVIALRTESRRGMGIHVSTVAGRDGGADGDSFARLNLDAYGAQPGDRLCWDLEPQIFRANPAAALGYGIAWSAAVRAAALSPVIYSTPDGCAYIGDKGFDAVWAAVPGQCDPSQVFAPSFFPGMVAVQCAAGSRNGVDYDVSISQFDFVGPAPTPTPEEDEMPIEVIAYHNPAVEVGALPLDLTNQLNCTLDRVYVNIRDRTNTGNLTARVVLVGDGGTPITSQDLHVGSRGGSAEWQLPAGPGAPIGHLVLQSSNVPLSVTVKLGKL